MSKHKFQQAGGGKQMSDNILSAQVIAEITSKSVSVADVSRASDVCNAMLKTGFASSFPESVQRGFIAVAAAYRAGWCDGIRTERARRRRGLEPVS